MPAAKGSGMTLDAPRRISRAALPVACALLALLIPAGRSSAADELRYFRIGTGGFAGTYFEVGAALANLISKPPGSRECEHGGGCGVTGLVAVAQATQGSAENANLVGSGGLESGLVQADVAHWTANGDAPRYRGCVANRAGAMVPARTVPLIQPAAGGKTLRAIAGLFPETIHIVVRAESKIRALKDLRGKRVGLGEAGSGTLADARLLLAAAGLSECDLHPQYRGLSQSTEALSHGEIDAFFLVAGYPAPAVADLAAIIKLRLLPLPAATVAALRAKDGFIAATAIPGATYPGIDAATPSAAVTAVWVTGARQPEDLVQAITAALWQEDAEGGLAGAPPPARRIRLERALAGFDLPLHSGAARFYRQAGLLKGGTSH
jgi:hypothetical protein